MVLGDDSGKKFMWQKMIWKKNIRATGLIEWVCECGVGHPDRSSAETIAKKFKHKTKTWLIHSCCGCCKRNDFPGKKKLIN